jgi:hypothetical protein
MVIVMFLHWPLRVDSPSNRPQVPSGGNRSISPAGAIALSASPAFSVIFELFALDSAEPGAVVAWETAIVDEHVKIAIQTGLEDLFIIRSFRERRPFFHPEKTHKGYQCCEQTYDV